MARSVKALESSATERPVRRQVANRAGQSGLRLPNEIFADEAIYDQSVEAVIALIKSGQVPPREPDEA